MRLGDLERLYVLNKKAAHLIKEDYCCYSVTFETLMCLDINLWDVVFTYKKYKDDRGQKDSCYIEPEIMNIPIDVLNNDSTTFKLENNYLKLADIGKETLNNI